MNRRRLDPLVEVCGGQDGPTSFHWRGRRFDVRHVIAHWVEVGPWWVTAGSGSDTAERDVWRVEAVSRGGTAGVYDLSVGTDVGWLLTRVID